MMEGHIQNKHLYGVSLNEKRIIMRNNARQFSKETLEMIKKQYNTFNAKNIFKKLQTAYQKNHFNYSYKLENNSLSQ